MKDNKIVYCWLADGIPFYIGIGNPKRAYTYKGRTSHSTNKRLKAEREGTFETRILHENLTWQEACELEQSYIALYGRRDLGTGILTNMTTGGDYSDYWTGRKRSDETKQKLSKINSGENHPQYGTKQSVESLDKMKNNMPTSKSVKTPLGIFRSQSEAAKAIKCSVSSISRRCNNPNFPDYKFT